MADRAAARARTGGVQGTESLQPLQNVQAERSTDAPSVPAATPQMLALAGLGAGIAGPWALRRRRGLRAA